MFKTFRYQARVCKTYNLQLDSYACCPESLFVLDCFWNRTSVPPRSCSTRVHEARISLTPFNLVWFLAFTVFHETSIGNDDQVALLSELQSNLRLALSDLSQACNLPNNRLCSGYCFEPRLFPLLQTLKMRIIVVHHPWIPVEKGSLISDLQGVSVIVSAVGCLNGRSSLLASCLGNQVKE